jgi:hypothetical protein
MYKLEGPRQAPGLSKLQTSSSAQAAEPQVVIDSTERDLHKPGVCPCPWSV